MIDARDNCVGVANADQADAVGAGVGSACPIVPLLTSVEPATSEGHCLAHFGYRNNDTVVRTIDVGKFNRFMSGRANRNQPTAFKPGQQNNVFTVDFLQGSSVTWRLDGANATAAANTAGCQYTPPPPA